MAKNVALGTVVRDRLSGFQGVVVCRTEWLTGCARLGVQSQTVDEKGRLGELEHFDEPRVVIVKAATPNEFMDELEPPAVSLRTGGGREEGRRNFDPPAR